MRYLTQSLTCWLVLHTLLPALAAESTSPALPLFRVVDLNLGEAAQTTLSDGKKVNVKLLDVDETRDTIRSAVRLARVSVEVDGRKLTLDSGKEAAVAGRICILTSKRFNLPADGASRMHTHSFGKRTPRTSSSPSRRT